MSTLKVRLADAPTDVLIHLIDNGPATVSELATALAPDDTIDPRATVSYAIDLLRRLGYVRCHNQDAYEWVATADGANAVRAARAAATDGAA